MCVGRVNRYSANIGNIGVSKGGLGRRGGSAKGDSMYLESHGHGFGQTILQLFFRHRKHVNIKYRQRIERIRKIIQENVEHLT